MAGSALLLAGAYRWYGQRVARWLRIDDNIVTPAHNLQDGIDYIPARRAVLLGHHFASIAGAAPIIGPITAAVFGWVPVLAWILLGGIFAGAVHDMVSLVASARHDGKSIGHIIELHVGEHAKNFFLIFAWATLILVIGVFTILVARTFAQTPAAASSSVLFIFLALLFGLLIYRTGIGLGWASIIGVIGLVVCLLVGHTFPLELGAATWTFLLLGYVFLASVTPVWVLLQPRDYLSAFLLYAMLLGALAGLAITAPAIRLPAFGAFDDPVLGTMFPVLFVTVACGAISGFHSMVASGTSAKQLDRESDARMIGYGGMLIESLLAVMALATAFTLTRSAYMESAQIPSRSSRPECPVGCRLWDSRWKQGEHSFPLRWRLLHSHLWIPQHDWRVLLFKNSWENRIDRKLLIVFWRIGMWQPQSR